MIFGAGAQRQAQFLQFCKYKTLLKVYWRRLIYWLEYKKSTFVLGSLANFEPTKLVS